MHAEEFMKDNEDMKSINQSGVAEYRKKYSMQFKVTPNKCNVYRIQKVYL